MKTKPYIGLDAHRNSISVATAEADDSLPCVFGNSGGSKLYAERGMVKVFEKSESRNPNSPSFAKPARLASFSPAAFSNSDTNVSSSAPRRAIESTAPRLEAPPIVVSLWSLAIEHKTGISLTERNHVKEPDEIRRSRHRSNSDDDSSGLVATSCSLSSV